MKDKNGYSACPSIPMKYRDLASNRKEPHPIYGLYRTMKDVRRHAKQGINVLIQEPLQWVHCIRAVRGSQCLVLHELRRYARLPIATTVAVHSTAAKCQGTSIEISEGGISIAVLENVSVLDSSSVRLTFGLPGVSDVSVQAQVCWIQRSDNMIGAPAISI